MKFDNPSRSFHLWLLALSALNFVPHFTEHFSFAFSFLCMTLLWRLAFEFGKLRLPNTAEKVFLIALVFGSIYWGYGTLRGMEAMTAALLGASSLKFLDNVRYRDAMVLLFVNFLLLMSAILSSQSLSMSIFAALDCVLISALMFRLHSGKDLGMDLSSLLKMGAKTLLATLPLLILLFFVFPRFSSGLIGGATQKQASSGFGDDIGPGEVENLTLNDDLAFRVRFLDAKPRSSHEMYWRGATYSKNEGLSWKKSEEYSVSSPQYVEDAREASSYEVLLEADYGKWVFLLDVPDGIYLKNWRSYKYLMKGQDASYQWKQGLTQRVLYKASYKNASIESLSEKQRDKYLEMPDEKLSSQIQELVERLNAEKTLDSFLRNSKEYFTENFRYSLNLKNKSSKSIEEFLFQRREGFCEHFASAMAYLARASGYPSRVVAGFQGAKKNPISDYYLVTNRNAHAWVEIWDDKTAQWRREDPTASVAPLRFQLGADVFYSFPQDELEKNRSYQEWLDLYNSSTWLVFYRQTQLYLDELSRRWTYFLLNYDFEAQKDLFKRFGLSFENRKLLSLISVLVLALFFLGYWLFRRRALRIRVREEVKIYRSLEKKLQSFGFYKRSNQGYSDYFQEVSKTLQIPEMLQYQELFLELRYGKSKSNFEDLKKMQIGLMNKLNNTQN